MFKPFEIVLFADKIWWRFKIFCWICNSDKQGT